LLLEKQPLVIVLEFRAKGVCTVTATAKQQQEGLAEGLARLTALKSNLPAGSIISEQFVSAFHAALDVLEQSAGADLNRFRIPESALHKIMTNKSPLTGTTNYSRERQCDRSLLMVRIETVLGFFRLQKPDTEIGFKA
jgi:hypothetical protein